MIHTKRNYLLIQFLVVVVAAHHRSLIVAVVAVAIGIAEAFDIVELDLL